MKCGGSVTVDEEGNAVGKPLAVLPVSSFVTHPPQRQPYCSPRRSHTLLPLPDTLTWSKLRPSRKFLFQLSDPWRGITSSLKLFWTTPPNHDHPVGISSSSFHVNFPSSLSSPPLQWHLSHCIWVLVCLSYSSLHSKRTENMPVSVWIIKYILLRIYISISKVLLLSPMENYSWHKYNHFTPYPGRL